VWPWPTLACLPACLCAVCFFLPSESTLELIQKDQARSSRFRLQHPPDATQQQLLAKQTVTYQV